MISIVTELELNVVVSMIYDLSVNNNRFKKKLTTFLLKKLARLFFNRV